ncbi:MAG TPA: hypothetical protein VF234_08195 [Limnochordia bacterium]
MAWGYHGFSPLCWIFVLLLIGFVIFQCLAWRRCGARWGDRERHRDDAEALLARRLAAGEIDEADYQRLKEILRR